MDFKQLEIFVAVAKHNSFSKAAKELFLTQPTVSSHMQNLENELNTVLINRNNKSVNLTEAGKILYGHALEILNNRQKALYNLNEYSGKIEGIIDMACSSIPETYILPGFLKFFISKYPDVKFNISHYDSQDAISEIIDEKISFGLVGSKVNNPQIKYVDLVDDELVLIASKELEIPNDNGYINIEDIKKFNFIMRKEGSGTRNLIVKQFGKNKVELEDFNVIAHVENNETIKEMVRIGLGLSFVSYRSAIDYIDTNKINYYKIKNMEFSRNFYFIHSKKKTFTPLEEKLLDGLYEYFDIKKGVV
jgi:LysR family transcriptional regulator, transcriptional activator of the cysJI operon